MVMPSIDINALDGDLLLRGVWEGLGRPEIHLTGGYLRDRLLGGNNSDLDLVLPGTIDDTHGPAKRLAARLDTSAHILGRGEKSVWRIETSEINIELWPLGDLSLDDDIRRRDFSINALVRPLPDGAIVDRVGGLDDLGGGVLRAISKKNLEEDPVRLLRAPRFLAQLDGFEIDSESARWIRDLTQRLHDAPRERVGTELSKLVRAPGAARGLQTLGQLGLLLPAAPEGSSCDVRWLDRNLDTVHRLVIPKMHPVPAALLQAGDSARLAPLFLAWGTPDEKSLAPYAWPREIRRHAVQAAELLQQALATVGAPIKDRRAMIHMVGTGFPAVLAFAAAVQPDHPWRRWWRLWLERGAELVCPSAMLTGNEIAEIVGLKPGSELGRVVRSFIEAQVRGEFRSRAGSIRWLRGMLGELGRPGSP